MDKKLQSKSDETQCCYFSLIFVFFFAVLLLSFDFCGLKYSLNLEI